MRMIKLGVISLLGIGILVWGMSLLLPSRTRVSRAITLPHSVAKVSGQITDLRQWKNWNRLFLYDDSLMIISGEGELVAGDMKLSVLNKRPEDIVIVWSKAGQDPVQSHFVLSAVGVDSSIVQWYFDFDANGYPWKKFSSIIYDRQLGPLMERSLEQLANTVEQAH